MVVGHELTWHVVIAHLNTSGGMALLSGIERIQLFCKYFLDGIFTQRNESEYSKDCAERHEHAFNSSNHHAEDSVLAFFVTIHHPSS